MPSSPQKNSTLDPKIIRVYSRYKNIFVSNYPLFLTSTIVGVCCSNQTVCNISFSYRKNYVIYPKKRMDMGKCTSCILYIKQNPTTYKETTSFAFLLESSTTNKSIPNNIIYSRLIGLSIRNGWPCVAKNKLNKFRKSVRPIK